MCEMRKFRSFCACAKYHPGLCSPFIPGTYIISTDFVSGQWRPWSDCADAQADLGLHSRDISEDIFSHDAAHMSRDMRKVPWSVKTRFSRITAFPARLQCAQRKHISACASIQGDQSLRCPPEDVSGPWLPTECPAKALIRLRKCAGWSGSSLGGYAIL